jgi:hypothetical protein
MPWKEGHVVDERVRFVARLLDGEKMAVLCPGVRDLAQDRIQDLRAAPGHRDYRTPFAPTTACPLPRRTRSSRGSRLATHQVRFERARLPRCSKRYASSAPNGPSYAIPASNSANGSM